MRLKARNDIHLARRIWHFCGVLTIFLCYVYIPEAHRRSAVLILCGVPVLLDIGRQFIPGLNHTLTKLFGPFMRTEEAHRIAGMSYMLAGCGLVILLFPEPVVRLSLLMFSVADPLASYFGIIYGKDRLIGQKTLQGAGAAFAACFAISLGYFAASKLMTERLFIVGLISALIGSFSELLPLGKIDDNFLFPVTSSILLYGVFYLFGGL
jgi:dolichol kinase